MERIIYRKTLDVHKNGIQFMLQGFETADNLSRVIEVSLMASGDAIDFPLEQMVAMMYVKTPSAAEPSINACTIKDNKVIYEVLPIVKEGITEMQLKLIDTSLEGTKRVLCSPKFAVEVTKSEADDTIAEQTTTFTALENAVARANAVYDRRIEDINVDSECIFRIFYADGTVYETDELRRLILRENTDINLDTMIKDGIIGITADEVAESLDERYRDIFAKAELSSDLFADYNKPTFVEWNSDTLNTPYKAGLTDNSSGFAFVFGTTITNHTAVTWTRGSHNEGVCTFIHKYIDTIDIGWDSYVMSSGGTMTGPLGLGGGKGSMSADDEGTSLKATTDSNHERELKLIAPNPETTNTPLAESVKFFSTINGIKNEFNLFGEHNTDLLRQFGYAKIEAKTYTGTGYEMYHNGIWEKTLTFGFVPQIVIVYQETYGEYHHFVMINGMTKVLSFEKYHTVQLKWSNNSVTWYGSSYAGEHAEICSNLLNAENVTYRYIAIG